MQIIKGQSDLLLKIGSGVPSLDFLLARNKQQSPERIAAEYDAQHTVNVSSRENSGFGYPQVYDNEQRFIFTRSRF
ncbi:Uncharacterised protein [Shigella dysenteriae]|uniref:Uncharacterized protein n=1 Tax=Shigella dysenteriae TaxID=622 RepID=A0A3P6KCN9_SHIDY|nr:Uncharacterised protein [Shigella dysenteriae]